MSVGAYTYGTVARVEALVGDVVASRAFAAGTTPTLTQVEAFLDDIAAQIVAELSGARYTVETATALATNQPRVHEFLRAINSYGAAALVLQTSPAVAFMGGEEGEGGDRPTQLWREYQRGLKMIRDGRLSAARSTIQVYAGSQEDEDGNTKKPIFTRDVTDYPSTWSLTE